VTLEELEGAYRRDRAAFERIAVAIVGDKQFGYDAVPPEGSILVFDSGIAVMRKDGLYLALEASSEGLLLAAARGLERVPPS